MAKEIKLAVERDKILSPASKGHIAALQCLIQAGNDAGVLNDDITQSIEEQINITMNAIAEDCYKQGKIWWTDAIKHRKGKK